MDQDTVKHLELIQGVVNRLANNSFAYKAWAITLVAVFILLATAIASPHLLPIALIPALGFWGLDAYYLRQQRLFRKLYDAVRSAETIALADGAFSMDTTPFDGEVASWLATACSKTLLWLYAPIAALILLATAIAFVGA